MTRGPDFPTFEDALETITKDAHWRIEIHPLKYKKQRIASANDLKQAIERARVRLRGWDFPHLAQDRDNHKIRGDCLWSMVKFEDIAEVWRFCKTGQFIGKMRVREAGDTDWQSKLRAATGYTSFSSINSEYADITVLSFGNQIWNVTEFYEFASRLAKATEYLEGIRISLTLNNVARFAIGEADLRRHFSIGKINEDESIEIDRTLAYEEISAKPHVYALDAIKKLFMHFQLDVRDDIIQHEIRELYGMRIGGERNNPDELHWGANEPE